MSNKKNIIISIILFIVFFSLFPLNLTSNLKYESVAATTLNSSKLNILDNTIPFIFADSAGYFTEDLSKSWRFNINDGVTLLSDSYINFSKDLNAFNIVSVEGELRYSVNDSGYPFNIGNRLYIIGRNRKRLSEVVNGEILWTRDFNSIITTLDSNHDNLVVGFDKGNFLIINNDGKVFFNYEPGGSRKLLIYSIKISSDGNFITIISGLDPQRFILYERKESGYKPVYSFNLKDEVRKSLKLFITEDNKKVFIEGIDGLYVLDIDAKEYNYFEDDYSLKNISLIENLNLYVIHTGAINFNKIRIITEDNRTLLYRNFISNNVSIKTRNESLYIVLDGSAIKLDLLEDK